MLYLRRIKHKGLKRLYDEDDESGVNSQWAPKLRRILSALNVICSPEEIVDLPGYRHPMKGNRKGTHSLTVTGNWRVTFEWDSEGPFNVNLEDYHGR